MKQRFLITAILTIIYGCVMAQKDSTEKVRVVYIFYQYDTVKVNTLIYKGHGNNVMWCSPGWQIFKGRAYIQDKKRYWVENPQIVGALDNNRHPVKPID